MTSLARVILGHRWLVIGIWVVLTAFGAFAAGQVSKRWFESFSIPGYSAYEANQRTLKTFGSGEFAPLVAVVRTPGDVTKAPGVQRAFEAAAAVNKGARTSSYFTTGSPMYLSKDRHTAYELIFRPGTPASTSPSVRRRHERRCDGLRPPERRFI